MQGSGLKSLSSRVGDFTFRELEVPGRVGSHNPSSWRYAAKEPKVAWASSAPIRRRQAVPACLVPRIRRDALPTGFLAFRVEAIIGGGYFFGFKTEVLEIDIIHMIFM